ADIIKKYGADLIRLWAGSADYHADVRCSENIFKQLSQTYLKFRNTARYCLGNLAGFNADDLVAPAEMAELDRWAITRLNKLIETGFRAYNDYEFHVVSHAINDFCVTDLSSFYLDIIKDRLYCDGKDSLSRRSAQTALFLILDTMTKLFAPILAFTCDEIWLAMPHRSEDDARNVLLNEMNNVFTDYALDADAMAKWDTVMKVRSDVNGVLERARADKRIGKSLEAQVRLFAGDAEAAEALKAIAGMDLADLFIISNCEIAEGAADADKVVGAGEIFKGLTVEASEAAGAKCPRCWKHSLNAQAETDLCPRCAAVISEMDLEI
ncbi:MAG: class I tRNA ligase family protein, partial [Oscillospiraceae bacterium]|nr:class I tRNA ligase family protein [Oscillospiraceae bacterium]